MTEDSISYEVKKGDTLYEIAKKFNTTVELIKKSNNIKNATIRPGDKLKIINTKFSVVVDKSKNTLTLKEEEEVLKVYPVSTGINNSTPVGTFKIVNKLIDPVWYKTGAIVAAESPDNILGSRWMGLSVKGYGIHGTTQPETIGKQITQGCIRMYNSDVEELYSILPMGTEVIIMD
jgi:lipoprotein-anchoring transpeptidase ErfK/SrfK